MQRNGVLFVVLFFLISRWGAAGTFFMPRSFMPGSFMPTSGSGVFAGDGERTGGSTRSGLTLSSLLPEGPEFELLLPEDFGVKQVSMPEDNGQVPVDSGEHCTTPWTVTHLHAQDELKKDISLTCWPIELHREQAADSFPAIRFQPDTEPYEELTTDALQYAGLLTGEGQIYHAGKPLSYDSGVIALRSDVLVYRQQSGQYWLVVHVNNQYLMVSLTDLLGSQAGVYFEFMWERHFGDHPSTFAPYGRQSTRARHNSNKTPTKRRKEYPLRSKGAFGETCFKHKAGNEALQQRSLMTAKRVAKKKTASRLKKEESSFNPPDLIRNIPHSYPIVDLFPDNEERQKKQDLPEKQKALLKKWEQKLKDAGFAKRKYVRYWEKFCLYTHVLQDALRACTGKKYCFEKIQKSIKTNDQGLGQWLTELAKEETQASTKDNTGVSLFALWLDEITLKQLNMQDRHPINWRDFVVDNQAGHQHSHDSSHLENTGTEELSAPPASDMESVPIHGVASFVSEGGFSVNPEGDSLMDLGYGQPEAEADVLSEQQEPNNPPEDETVDEAVVTEAKEVRHEAEIEGRYIEQTSPSRVAEILMRLFGERHSNEASVESDDDSDTFNWGSLSM